MSEKPATVPRTLHEKLRCTVITVSDTRTIESDESGQLIARLLSEAGHEVVERTVAPEDSGKIALVLRHWIAVEDIDAIIFSGGEGPGVPEGTVEVVGRFLQRELPGYAELFRVISLQEIGSGAMYLRIIGGVARDRLVFTLPGSAPLVQLGMQKLILPEIGYLVREIRRNDRKSL